MSVTRSKHIDNQRFYPGELEIANGKTAFEILRTRYLTAQPEDGRSSLACTKTGSITITRSTLAVSSFGSNPQQLASAWPKSRSNSWVFDLFSHERLMAGDAILVPAQTTFGTISGLTSDNDDKPEAELDLAPQTIPIRKAAVWTKVSDETVEDLNGFSAWMNSELTRQILSEIDDQLLNGDGTKPSLHGLLSTTGYRPKARAATR